jgi:triacylglycerol esterase/lipase EstA (alpha/beta hydrolase family)
VSAAHVAIVVLLVAVAGCVLFNVFAYAGAARDRRRQPRRVPDEDEPSVVARTGAAFAAFVGECGATVALMLVTPLSFERRPRGRGGGPPERRPVLLLHGYLQHPANFLSLRRRLRRDGWAHVYTLRHAPMFGDIERSAARLGSAIDRIREATGAPAVDVVAHSMGGLVARAYVRARGSASGIARLVTLGTPHQGTHVFRRLAHDPMLVQMRPDSPLLRRLASDDPVPTLVECVAIYSTGDAVVVPPHNGYYKGAFNIEIAGTGHMSLLFSRRVYDLVRENLEAPLDATRAAAASS